jgi:hypothetical protein
VEVHANAGGRLVVTIEGSSYAHCADMAIKALTRPGNGYRPVAHPDNDGG